MEEKDKKQMIDIKLMRIIIVFHMILIHTLLKLVKVNEILN
jgi:hypothetical protein